jgi:hypothetical protein
MYVLFSAPLQNVCGELLGLALGPEGFQRMWYNTSSGSMIVFPMGNMSITLVLHPFAGPFGNAGTRLFLTKKD